MKKLILLTLILAGTFNPTGGLMANRLDELNAEFQSKRDAMKADTENARGYTLRHIMLSNGIRHTLELADHFDMADVAKKASLEAKKASAAEHLTRVENEKSRELLQFILDQLTEAAEQNSAEPLLDLAERELAAFDEDGETPLDALKLQLWVAADEAEVGDAEKVSTLIRTTKNFAMS